MYRGGENTSTPEIWAAGRAVERSQFVLRYERDECNRVAGGLADVVYAVPRAGTGTLYTKVTCECAIRCFSDPRGLFSQPLRPLFFFKKRFLLEPDALQSTQEVVAKSATTPTPRPATPFWTRRRASLTSSAGNCTSRPLNLGVYWKSLFCDHNLSGPADGTSVVWVTVSVAHNFARITEGGLGRATGLQRYVLSARHSFFVCLVDAFART